jgi:hypothetical protein
MIRPGTPCEACSKRGHFCPAAVLLGKIDGDGDEALCLDCADEKPCAAERCRGQVRENSSAVVRPEELYAMDSAGSPPPIVSRTPEELGIPRVVSTVPALTSLEMAGLVEGLPEALKTARWPAGADLAMMERRLGLRASEPRKVEPRKASEDSLKGVKTRTVIDSHGRGVRVRMIAHAVMGAEMIDEFAAEAAKEAKCKSVQGESVTNNFDMTSELNQKIAAEPVTTRAAEIAASLNVPVSRVYGIRCQMRREGKLAGRGKRQAQAAKKPGTKLAATVRRVEIDPQRPGTAAALIDALAKRDAAGATAVRLELTAGEVALLVGKLNDEQRGAFLAAGLKAAILG